MDFPRSSVESLLKQHGCEKWGEYRGHDIWITKEGMSIQLPHGRTVHSDLVEPILLSTIGMSVWDYDYWLGQNCIN